MANEVEQLRDEVHALREQLAHAQRLASLGELASTTAHEFNNVLMTILNYAKLALRNKDEASRDKYLWQYEDLRGQWLSSRMHAFELPVMELVSAPWKEVPAALKSKLDGHYVD